MTPSLCRRCTRSARVVMQKGAGLTAGFRDDEYWRARGVTLVSDAAKVWRAADFIFEGEGSCCRGIRPPCEGSGDLHLPAPRGGTEARGSAAQAHPRHRLRDGRGRGRTVPLLKPMSQIAGGSRSRSARISSNRSTGLGRCSAASPARCRATWSWWARHSGAHAVQMAVGMGGA